MFSDELTFNFVFNISQVLSINKTLVHGWTWASSLSFVLGGKVYHKISLPSQGGAEGRVRFLLTKNPACFFSCPFLETRYLV